MLQVAVCDGDPAIRKMLCSYLERFSAANRIDLSATLFESGEVHGSMVIRIENPYVHALRPQNGTFDTTKEDRALHGCGLLNIRRIVEQKGVTVTFQTENGVFTVTWMIPLPGGWSHFAGQRPAGAVSISAKRRRREHPLPHGVKVAKGCSFWQPSYNAIVQREKYAAISLILPL